MKRDKKGRFVKGFKHTRTFKLKMSKRISGENHPMFGKHHTNKTKRKMRIAKIGKESPMKGKKREPHTKQWKENARKRMLGKNNE